MLEKIYNNFLVELQNDGVAINEVPSAELKRQIPNSEIGFISYNCNRGSFHSTYILIDSSIELELKLNVLIHEYGHYTFWKSLGCDQLMRLKENGDNWMILDEYNAFKYQLENIYEIALQFVHFILRNTMNRIIERHKSDPDMRYREALNCLLQDEIWKKSLELYNLSFD
jgi:hypothetical protein